MHIQAVSKTHFYNKILTSKIFGKPQGTLESRPWWLLDIIIQSFCTGTVLHWCHRWGCKSCELHISHLIDHFSFWAVFCTEDRTIIGATSQTNAYPHTISHQLPREIKNVQGLGSTTTNRLWPQSNIAFTIKFNCLYTILRCSNFPQWMGRSWHWGMHQKSCSV